MKRIYITEDKHNKAMAALLKEESYSYGEKVMAVKDYLDKNFQRA